MMLRAMFLLLLLATTAFAQQKGWEKEWNETLAAAKKEGQSYRRRIAGPGDAQ